MGFINQSFIRFVGAETRVYTVVVGSGIAMIRAVQTGIGCVVFQYRGKPKGGHAQLGEVIQMLANAFEVAAVAQAGLRTVYGIGVETFNPVVFGIARCKPVGHQHI